jgi:hypothetical protein
MAEALHEVGLGYSIDGLANIIRGTDDPTSVGKTAPLSSLYLRNTGSGGELYQKTGATSTDWTLLATSSGISTEDGFIQAFIGKDGDGSELPSYSSVTQITQNNSLEAAIGELDAAIGADPTAETRTNNPIVPANAVNANIDLLDSAIGSDAQMVNQNIINDANTISTNLSLLDGQVNQNTSDISALQAGFKWIQKVKVVTGDDISAKSGTAVTFSDNDGAAITLSAGDRIASVNPASDDLIYIVQAGAWTTVTPATNDQFFVDHNLPNPVNEEGVAAYKYDGTTMVEVAAFDFEAADSINIAAGYSAASGDVIAGDTVQEAVQKVDGNVDAVNTSLGTSQGATNLGTFTGTIISDNTSVKSALQELESEIGDAVTPDSIISDQAVNLNIEALSAAIQEGRVEITVNGITSTTGVDSVSVDAYHAVEWDIIAYEAANPSNKEWLKVSALHNGTTAADATTVDWDRKRRKIGAQITGYDVDVTLSGTTTSQVMNLEVTSTDAVNIELVRRSLV